jgi:gluconate 2-dehydrogenase gamma chain
MSDITRRDAIARLAQGFVAAGIIESAAGADLHAQLAAQAGGDSRSKALSDHHFATLQQLVDLIIPTHDGHPGGVEARVPAWIDALLAVNDPLKARFTAGLDWLDATMLARVGVRFAAATNAHQTALLDQIAFQRNRTPDLSPGIDFFVLARRMSVDGFYTSPIGMRTVYLGNQARASFEVPKATLDYVIARSPFK